MDAIAYQLLWEPADELSKNGCSKLAVLGKPDCAVFGWMVLRSNVSSNQWLQLAGGGSDCGELRVAAGNLWALATGDTGAIAAVSNQAIALE